MLGGKRERGESVFEADPLGNELIERLCVAKGRLPAESRPGEEALPRPVTAGHARV